MRRIRTTLLGVALVASVGLAVPTLVHAAAEDDSLARQLEMARDELDKAARKLAKLYESAATAKVKPGHGRAMLGVLIGEPEHDTDGILIVGVTPKAGAAAAGMKSGDRILALNGIPLDGEKMHPHKHIGYVMRSITPGDPIAVEYLRDGALQTTEVVTHEASHKVFAKEEALEKALAAKEFDLDFDIDTDLVINGQPFAEMLREVTHAADVAGSISPIVIKAKRKKEGLVTLSPDLAGYFQTPVGVLVLEPGDGSSLRAGDVIVRVDKDEIASVEQLIDRCSDVDPRDKIAAVVVRKGERKKLQLRGADIQIAQRQSIHIMGDDGELGEIKVTIEDGS